MNVPGAIEERTEALEASDPDELALPPRRGRRRARLAVNLTSLIDVTFLLLIYFMIATSMTGAEEVFRTDLPNREGVGRQDPFKLDVEPLRISVMSTGLGPEMCFIRMNGPYPQPANVEALHQFLKSKQVNESNVTTGALFAPDHPIIVEPTRSARWDHAMEVFNAAARAHYTNITFAKPG